MLISPIETEETAAACIKNHSHRELSLLASFACATKDGTTEPVAACPPYIPPNAARLSMCACISAVTDVDHGCDAYTARRKSSLSLFTLLQYYSVLQLYW